MIRTNKTLNKKSRNNIPFQDLHSNIKTSFLSFCPSWIILTVSGLLFIQANPLNAMEQSGDEPKKNSDIMQKSKSKKGQYREVPQKDNRSLTQEFCREECLSSRLNELIQYMDIDKIKEEIKNDKKNSIGFTKDNLNECKKILKSSVSNPDLSLDNILIPHSGLIGSQDMNNPKKPDEGRSGNKVVILSRENKMSIAIKKFTQIEEGIKGKKVDKIEEGLKELLYSLIALDLNHFPEGLKMARIYDAFICPENTLNIIMEAANGEGIHDSLLKNNPENVVKACANYLATFHIRNFRNENRYINNKNGEKHIQQASVPHHTLIDNLLAEKENQGIDLLNLSIGKKLRDCDIPL